MVNEKMYLSTQHSMWAIMAAVGIVIITGPTVFVFFCLLVSCINIFSSLQQGMIIVSLAPFP